MRVILLAGVFAAASQFAFAQQDTARPVDNCHTTLRAGSGVTFTKVCISSTGNVTSFESPAGVEHIRVVDPVEGYRICRGDDWAPAWDSGSTDYGMDVNHGPIIHQPNGPNTLPLRITRDAFNGVKIVQDFFFRVHSFGPAELKIQMQVRNTGAATLGGIWVQRFFDADINGRLSNHAFVTANTAAIMIPGGGGAIQPNARGLSLSAGILDKTHWANEGLYETLMRFIESGDPTDCNAGDPQFGGGATPSDKLGVITYDVGDILPGRVKTVAFIYSRF